jgi:hypothetical protein
MKKIRKILIGFLILFIVGMVFLYFYITIPSVRDGEILGRIKFPSNNSVYKFPEKLQPLPNLR